MTVSVVLLNHVCRNQGASVAAARGALSLMERGFSRYGHAWDLPAIAAMDGSECVGVLLLEHLERENTLNVALAWCSDEHPRALAAMLLRLRDWCRFHSVSEVTFTAHQGNSHMEKAAAALQATMVSRTYRVKL